MHALEPIALASGVTAHIPSTWTIAVEPDEVSGEVHFISFSRENAHGELEMYQIGSNELRVAIDSLKFRTLELLASIGCKISPQSPKNINEIIARFGETEDLVFHQFKEDNPILHLSVRGLAEDEIDEVRYIFNSISVNKRLMENQEKRDEISILPFEIELDHWAKRDFKHENVHL